MKYENIKIISSLPQSAYYWNAMKWNEIWKTNCARDICIRCIPLSRSLDSAVGQKGRSFRANSSKTPAKILVRNFIHREEVNEMNFYLFFLILIRH